MSPLNIRLHELLGVEPCETGCTHVISGRWTVLGVANVLGRIDEEDERRGREVEH